MKLKNVFLMALSLVLVAALAIGGTVAFLQDSDDDVNVMTLGKVSIAQHEYQRVIENGTYQTDTIDNQTSYVLEAFEQGKALLPATDPTNYGAGKWDTTTVRMSQVNSYGGMQVFSNPNAQDKFVVVENTGKTDAYIRTLVAIEVGATDGSLVGSSFHSTWTKNIIGIITIDNNNYHLIEYVYAGGKLSDGSWRHEKGILPAGDTAYPSLSQVYLKSAATNEDMDKIDGNGNGTLDILVLSQAVQAKDFADAETALNAGFGDITTTNHPWLSDAPTFNTPENDDELEDSLKDENAKQIIVNLTDDVTYDVAAWANDAMGGEKTEYIMINGNGHTLTFNQTNSDWNNIVTNGAKLIINNAKITNAGKNDGPWNRHDLNFACEVELNNVVSDKALAFKADATLNNVTIDDANTSDTYAIWIQPNGQTVTLKDCTIDMLDCTDGRGIKIDEQYVTTPKKVTLNVSNTTFKTEEKSAILVKSVAGAEINLSNVDITAVKADPMHEVWVDEKSAAYADRVVVNGGKKIIEGTVEVATATNTEGFKSAISGGADAIFVDNADLTLGTINAGGADITVNGGSVNYGTTGGFKKGIQHSGVETYNNATITGSVSLYGEKVVFNNCTFDLTGISDYIWTYGAKVVEFNNCTFNTKGKAILVYNEGTVGSSVVTVNGCTFNASESAYASAVPGQACAAVEIDSSLIPGTYTLNFVGENVVDTEFSGLVRIKNDGGKNNVVINGATAVVLP